MIQPPTDNLYKFMAIVGLLLWVGGTFYPWTKAYEIESDLIIIEAQVAHLQAGTKEIDQIELDKQIKQIRLKSKAVIAYFIIGVISFCGGMYLMFHGFIRWYNLVQKPLDDKLRQEISQPNKSPQPTAESGG